MQGKLNKEDFIKFFILWLAVTVADSMCSAGYPA